MQLSYQGARVQQQCVLCPCCLRTDPSSSAKDQTARVTGHDNGG